MSIISKIKSLLSKTDSISIDINLLYQLDSDKLLKLYNVLSQLTQIAESSKETNSTKTKKTNTNNTFKESFLKQ